MILRVWVETSYRNLFLQVQVPSLWPKLCSGSYDAERLTDLEPTSTIFEVFANPKAPRAFPERNKSLSKYHVATSESIIWLLLCFTIHSFTPQRLHHPSVASIPFQWRWIPVRSRLLPSQPKVLP